MAHLRIKTIPDKTLRQRSKKVAKFDNELKKFVGQMIESMRHDKGIGLAAPQVGKSLRLIVAEYNPEREGEGKADAKPFPLTVLINPSITKFSKEKIIMDEGCLSLPDLELKVSRPQEVNVIGQDLEGKKIKIRAKGLQARVLQHEIDHLDGKLFTDIAEGVKNIENYRALKMVFMGTPQFGANILEALAAKGLPITGVITEVDKPQGRGMEIKPNAVKLTAEEFGLNVFQSDNKEEVANIIKQLKPHFIIVAAYGKILPQEVLEIPPYGVLNVHASLLPKYRGASPIQSAILNGEKESGVTIMKLDEKMDHGPIVSQKTVKIGDKDTYESLGEKMSLEGAKLLIETLPGYLSNQIMPEAQDESKATYTHLIKKEEGEIDWKKPANEIERMVRAFYPWPKAFTILNNKRLIIHKARAVEGKLVPETVQMEGKNVVSWSDFKRNFQGKLPEKLS